MTPTFLQYCQLYINGPTKVRLVKAMVFLVVMYGCESWTMKKEFMLLNSGVGEDSWVSLGLQGGPTSPSWRRSVVGVHWKDWLWISNCNTLAPSCEEMTHWKRPWCWEGWGVGGEGDNSPTQWTRVSVNSGSWWGTGRPGVLWFMGSQRVRRDWATELNWTELITKSDIEVSDFSTFLWIGRHKNLRSFEMFS